MIAGTVSGIQIATLVVAGLAVVASIAGIIFNAFFGRRSEHSVWQRDLRVRLYSECTELADSALRAIYDFILKQRSSDPADSAEALKQLERLQTMDNDVLALLANLQASIASVNTFGPLYVKEAALEMLKSFRATAVKTGPFGNTFEEMRESAQATAETLASFRRAVRKSLKISDD